MSICRSMILLLTNGFNCTNRERESTVELPFWPPCFYWFFGSCFGSLDAADLLAFEALQGLRGLPEVRMAGATVEEISSKAPPAVAKSTPTAAKLGCAFSHSVERRVDELGLLYPENRGNLRKNMASEKRTYS